MSLTPTEPPTTPLLRKARRVTGKTLVLRDATITDAAVILSLRTDEEKARFLSQVTPDLEAQRQWLEAYARATDQAYFIIEHQDRPIGMLRLYDPCGASFCWASWILVDSRPTQAAMESALMVYA